jgi:hypothetical protein
MHGNFTYLFNVIGMKTFGHDELIELINSLVCHHELITLNCLVGLIKFFKLSELIVKYNNGLVGFIGLVGHNGIVGSIVQNGLVDHNYLVNQNGLIGRNDLSIALALISSATMAPPVSLAPASASSASALLA